MTDATLDTPDFRLRPLSPADRRFYVALYGDDVVMQWVAPPLPTSVAERAFDAACRHQVAVSPGHRFWIVEPRTTHERIGLVAMKRTGRIGELGAMILPAWWNRGVSRQAFRAISRAAFAEWNMAAMEVRRPWDDQAVVVDRMLAAVGFSRPEPMGDGTVRWQLTPHGLVEA